MKQLTQASMATFLGVVFSGVVCLGGLSLILHQHTLHEYATTIEKLAQAPDTADPSQGGRPSPASVAASEGAFLKSKVRLAATVGVAALVITGLLAVYAAAHTSRPLRILSRQIGELHAGHSDLTRRLESHGCGEVRLIAKQVNDFIAGVQGAIEETSASSATVSDYSAQLSAAATTMASAAEEMGAQIGAVSAATEQISTSLSGVAAGAEQMTSSVSTVAAAIEEMSSSLNEVSRSSGEASGIALRADERTRVTKEIMDRLNGSAVQIGKVLDTISEISDQTNLLALNATIEAASAGEAGKGFAVVANEVKDLARQTATATEEIARQIEEMQSSTAEAAGAIGEISGVISDLNRISQTIASAVEEQSATVAEIASNVQGASLAVNEVARSISQTSEGAREIAANVQGLSEASKETAASTNEAQAGAEELATLVARQKEILGRFKTRPPRFDIGPVKAAHLAWRARLENALHGHRNMTAASVASHHECQFGRWYEGSVNESFAKHPAYAEVGRHHERVHQVARAVVEQIEAGQRERALERMQEFETVRRDLFASLDALYLS